jgi:hypothetical protein
MISFKEFIQESTILTIKNRKINIDLSSIDLKDTKHSKERLDRPENEGDPITEKEIVTAIEQAIQSIMSDVANGELKQNANVWINNTKTKLNLIIEINFKKGTDTITVVTVLRKSKFKSSNKRYLVG